jgi:hypothetical protein
MADPKATELPQDPNDDSYLEAAKRLEADLKAAQPLAYSVTDRSHDDGLKGRDLEIAIAKGTHTFQTGKDIPVISPDGTPGVVPADKIKDAIIAGFRLDDPTNMAARQFATEHPTWTKFVAGIHGASEGLGGLPEMIAKGAVPELDAPIVSAINAQATKRHQMISSGAELATEILPAITGLGEVGGLAAGAEQLITRGGAKAIAKAGAAEVVKDVAKAELPAALSAGEKALAKAGLNTLAAESAEQALPSLARQVAGRAANFATQGVLTSAPKATGQLFNGDPEKAAETLFWGGLAGGLFGAAEGGFIAAAGKAASPASKLLGRAIEAPEAVSEALAKKAGTAAEGATATLGGKVAGWPGAYVGEKLGEKFVAPHVEAFVKDATKRWLEGEGSQVAQKYLKDLAADPFNTSLGQAMASQGTSAFDQMLARVPGTLAAMGGAKVESTLEKSSEKKLAAKQAKDWDTQLVEFKKTSDKINDLAMNPDKLLDLTSMATHAFNRDEVSERIAMAFQSKAFNAVDYLHNNLPRPKSAPDPFTGASTWQPSPQQITSFNNKLEIARDPMALFSRLRDGTLTVDHTDAAKAIYPTMFNHLQKAVIETAAQPNAPKLSYPARVKLSQVMGVPLDRTVKNTAQFQQMFAQSNQEQDQAEQDRSAGSYPRKGTNLKDLPDVSTQSQRVRAGQPGRLKNA